MADFGISRIDYYIPDTELGIEELLDLAEDSHIPPGFADRGAFATFVRHALNLRAVRVDMERTTEEMISVVLERLFDGGGVDPKSIQCAILAQERGVNERRNLLQFLQHKYKFLNSRLFCVSGNHCANVLVAVKLACALMASDADIKRTLILTSSTKREEPPGKRIIGTYGILGDAAGLILLDRSDFRLALADCVMVNDGSFSQAKESDDNWLVHLYHTKRCLRALLKTSGLAGSDVGSVVLANANNSLVRECLATVGVEESKIFAHNHGRYGHLDCVDFVVNLKDLLSAEGRRPGPILAFKSGLAGSYVGSVFNDAS